MKISFWGAAREVTGSRHLVEANGSRVLLDCGLFQGRRDEAFHKNRHFGFDPERIDAVVLSHGHIDHTGALPALSKAGYTRKVHATSATADLSGVMLMDSAHIQEMDAETVNRREHHKGKAAREPLYTSEDAAEILDRFVVHPYGKYFEVAPGIEAFYRDAGHMLGSASVELRIKENGTTRRLVFSGDIGRPCLPILRDPVMVDGADTLIMESTYGDRNHPRPENVEEELEKTLKPVFERGGKVVIPAFAVGRTQEVVYLLNILRRDGRLPKVPVFIDSPLAVNVTEIFNRHPECYDREMREVLADPGDPFGFKTLNYVRSVEESKALNSRKGPCVIISASGMCEAGRVLHHLRNSIGDPNNAVVLVGFQAEHTLGRRLQEKREVVKIFGDEYPLRADVHRLDVFSGHADKDELLGFAKAFTQQKPERVFLVHGEPDQQEPLEKRLEQEAGYKKVDRPQMGQTVDLG